MQYPIPKILEEYYVFPRRMRCVKQNNELKVSVFLLYKLDYSLALLCSNIVNIPYTFCLDPQKGGIMRWNNKLVSMYNIWLNQICLFDLLGFPIYRLHSREVISFLFVGLTFICMCVWNEAELGLVIWSSLLGFFFLMPVFVVNFWWNKTLKVSAPWGLSTLLSGWDSYVYALSY